MEAFCHLTPNISYPLMIVISVLMLPVMIVRFFMGWMHMVLIDLPLIVASFWSLWAFYLFAQRELDRKNWKRTAFFLPALTAAGVALTLSNAKGVLEAIFGVETSFARTPKYAISGASRVRIADVRYRSRSGWLPYIEILAGTLFIGLVAYAIDTYNYLAIPFLLLFVAGYYWAGFSTLIDEYRGKLAFEKAREVALKSERS